VYDTYAPFSGQPFQWLIVGGTSVSSPFVAGIYARAGNLSQVIGPNTLYMDKASDFTDVTVGANTPPNSGVGAAQLSPLARVGTARPASAPRRASPGSDQLVRITT
jgi:hypothetical protein